MKINPSLENSLVNITKQLDTGNYVSNREQVVDLLRKFASDISKKSGKSVDKLFNEYVANNVKTRKRYKKEQREEVENLLREQLSRNKLVKGYKTFNKGIKNTNEGLVSVVKVLTPTDRPLSDLTSTIANVLPLFGIAAVFAAGAGLIDSLTSTYGSLTKTGIQVSGGLLGSIEATARMGLSFDEGAKLFSENALTVQKFGLPAISSFTDNLRNSSGELFSLGLTVKDVAQRSIEFLDIQRKIDSSNKTDLSQREDQFKGQLKKFYNATQMVGEDLGSLIDQYKKSAEDPLTRLFLQSLPEQTREAFIAFQKVAPKEAEAIQQAYFRGGNINRIDNYREYATIGAVGDLERLYEQFFNPAATNETIFGIIAEREPYYEQQFKIQSDMMNTQEAMFAASLAKLGNLINTDGANITEKVDKVTEGIINAQQAINNFYYNLKVALLEELQKIDLNGLVDNIEKISKSIADLIKGINTVNDVNNLPDFTAKIKEAAGVLSGKSSELNAAVIPDGTPLSVMILTGFAGIFALAATSPLLRMAVLDSIASYASGMKKLINGNKFSIPGIDGLGDIEIPDGDTGKKGNQKQHRESRNAARKAAGSAPESARTAASATGRRAALLRRARGIITKSASKGVIKALPILGAIGGLAFGAGRLLEGDTVGAGLEVVAGAAALLPAAGTATSVAATLALLAKDLAEAGFTSDEISEIIEETKKELMGASVTPDVGKLNEQEATQQLSSVLQELQKLQEEESLAKQEIPDAPPGLSRGARKKWQEDRTRLRKEIEEQYQERNNALRATIGALQLHIRESQKLQQAIPDTSLMP